MTKPINDGGPAYPFTRTASGAYGKTESYTNEGKTLRDSFAESALMGMCANTDWTGMSDDDVSRKCYEFADAMLIARGGE